MTLSIAAGAPPFPLAIVYTQYRRSSLALREERLGQVVHGEALSPSLLAPAPLREADPPVVFVGPCAWRRYMLRK